MNEADVIFAAAIEASKAMILEQRISQKKDQIRSVTTRRCGNCDLWMKSTCKPEKERGKVVSMNSFACSAFRFCPSSIMLKEEFEKELSEMQTREPTEGESGDTTTR